MHAATDKIVGRGGAAVIAKAIGAVAKVTDAVTAQIERLMMASGGKRTN